MDWVPMLSIPRAVFNSAFRGTCLSLHESVMSLTS